MASEEQEDRAVTLALPPDLQDWLAEEADRQGTDRETVCRQLLGAARTASSDDAVDPPGRAELEDLRARIDAQEEEFIEHVEDVRDRVIQVKREADAKAAADHDHEDLADADALAELRDDLETIEADLAALEDAFVDLEDRVDVGFDNYEEILDYLLAETDDLAERATQLADAVLVGRDRRRTLAVREQRRAETEALKLAANRLGVGTATCEDCGSSVDIRLLTRPECPHCASEFADVAPKSSLFGTPKLVTGTPPALEGRRVATDDSEDVFEAVADGADSSDEGATAVSSDGDPAANAGATNDPDEAVSDGTASEGTR